MRSSAARPVEERTADANQDVVAGGVLGGPGRQLLAASEELLDDDPRLRRGGAQPLEMNGGIAQAVAVVDAQAVDLAGVHPGEDAAVHGVEHRRFLDAQRDQGVDVGRVPPPPHPTARDCLPPSTALRAAVRRASVTGTVESTRRPPSGRAPVRRGWRATPSGCATAFARGCGDRAAGRGWRRADRRRRRRPRRRPRRRRSPP